MPTWASRLTSAEKAFSTSSVARSTANRYAASASASCPRAAAICASTRPKSNSRQRSPRTPRAWLAPRGHDEIRPTPDHLGRRAGLGQTGRDRDGHLRAQFGAVGAWLHAKEHVE